MSKTQPIVRKKWRAFGDDFRTLVIHNSWDLSQPQIHCQASCDCSKAPSQEGTTKAIAVHGKAL
jgi:hypothetical protein